jgi:hypothetical protein
MRWFLRSSALLSLALSSATAVVVASQVKVSAEARDQQIQDIIDWVSNDGGYFNDKLEIRRADSSDPKSYYGIFAKETIHPNERLMAIKRSSTIRHEDEDEQSLDLDTEADYFRVRCGLTKKLIKELRLGAKSKYAPYINYLLGQDNGQIPATWSNTGKAMLRAITREGSVNLDMTDWIKLDFEGKCIRNGDRFEIQAVALVGQRGYDSILVPLYDMANHSNDKATINMENTSVHGDVVRVWASREIPAGQELFTTYDHCSDCTTVPDDWGTPEILRDFGFVEPYPRKFQLGLEELLFSVHENKQTKQLEVTWLNENNESPDYEGIEWMKEYQRSLKGILHGGVLEAKRSTIPHKEWAVIFEYLQALLSAVDSATETAVYDLNSAKHDDDCDQDGNCSVPWLRYADLDLPIRASDDEYFFIYQCETLVYGIDHFPGVGRSISHYQTIEYYMEMKTKEMCFHIDGIFQMCSSYRPHYHEMAVHMPARYLLNSMKRVLWIGGGDAMLLHEILKYPDLELAVGLELDQKVTRGAFKYFGVQPHFDNEKVQWWFGDASKSLFMLPEDYFGSFDMVLVDLSDTVLSLSVTKEMDIVGALSLLLKPDGIFVMNELVRLFILDCIIICCWRSWLVRTCSLTYSSVVALVVTLFISSSRESVKCSSTQYKSNSRMFRKCATRLSFWRATTLISLTGI